MCTSWEQGARGGRWKARGNTKAYSLVFNPFPASKAFWKTD